MLMWLGATFARSPPSPPRRPPARKILPADQAEASQAEASQAQVARRKFLPGSKHLATLSHHSTSRSFGVLAVALVSVLVPLSLCVVPALARYTVFPLLSALVHKVAAAYLQPCVQLEFLFGAFPARAHRQRSGSPADSLRGVTVVLFAIKLQQEFLKTLAFAKQGLAPIALTAVAIKRMTIHMATTWKIVIKIDEMAIDGKTVDLGAPDVFELKDAVAMKLGEAGGLIGKLVAEKLKREQQQQHDQARAAASTPPAFSFKDRVVQLVAAQIDVHVEQFTVRITSTNPGSLQKPTRVTFGVSSFDLITDVKHEQLDEALQLVLTSSDIRVEHTMTIKGMNISAAKADALEASADMKKDDLKPSLPPGEVNLMQSPGMELKLDVPPMPRLLGIVENIAPIPLDSPIAAWYRHLGRLKSADWVKWFS